MNAFVVTIAAVLAQASDGAAAEFAARPAWVERGDWSEPPVVYRVVTSERWATREEARRDALERAGDVAREFAAQVDSRLGASWQVPLWLVQDRLIREEFTEEVDWSYSSLAPMYQSHLLVELSPAKRELMLDQWQHSVTQARVRQLGAGFGFVLVCLMTLLGYLRLDDATRGYYTGWLRTAAFGVVAATAAALYTWVV